MVDGRSQAKWNTGGGDEHQSVIPVRFVQQYALWHNRENIPATIGQLAVIFYANLEPSSIFLHNSDIIVVVEDLRKLW